jgi:chromosome segregation ATPase
MSKDLTKELPPSDPDKLDQILTAVSGLDSRLGKLEQTVEQRLYDTRPIWEKLKADIGKLQEGQAALQEGLAALQEGQRSLVEGQEFLKREVREIRTQMRDMYRRLSIFNDTLVTMQADYRDIYDRVRELEVQRP